jgi:hypothetical protein
MRLAKASPTKPKHRWSVSLTIFTGDAQSALRVVNTEEQNPSTCLIRKVAYMRGMKVGMVRRGNSAFEIVGNPGHCCGNQRRDPPGPSAQPFPAVWCHGIRGLSDCDRLTAFFVERFHRHLSPLQAHPTMLFIDGNVESFWRRFSASSGWRRPLRRHLMLSRQLKSTCALKLLRAIRLSMIPCQLFRSRTASDRDTGGMVVSQNGGLHLCKL